MERLNYNKTPTGKQELHLDFETYSDVDIKTCGMFKYVESPSFEILIVAYALNDGPVSLWRPLTEPNMPEDLFVLLSDESVEIHAYNALFEYICMLRDKRFPHINPTRLRDTQALALSFDFPASLEEAALACHALEKKDPKGKALIRLFSCPRKPTKKNPRTRIYPWDEPEKFEEFCQYCVQDVETERAVKKAMPKQTMSDFELLVWRHTQAQNLRGLPIDVPLVEGIVDTLTTWKEIKQAQLAAFTNGEITTGNQRDRILDWCRRHGYPLESLRANDVEAALSASDAPDEVKVVLRYRKALSRNSTAKFTKILQALCSDNTVKGNLLYHGAGTGRFAGRGFQVHNLPRLSADDPEPLIHKFLNRDSRGDDIMTDAVKLIRSCIKAPDGYDLVCADYSSIENRGLHWAAGDYKTLEEFRNGLDQYKQMAVARYHVAYDEVTKEQRQVCKAIILGCGYQMGARTFQTTAADYGLDLTLEEAQEAVNYYRNFYPLVPQLWRKLYNAAIRAIQTRRITKYNVAQFLFDGRNLYMKLPSGRGITYNEARLEEQVMPWGETKIVITFMGEHPETKKWTRLSIRPGRLTENLVQALCRDILVYGVLQAEAAGYEVLATIHDEVLTLVPEGTKTAEGLCEALCKLPDWAVGFPVAAEGWVGKRFRK